MGYTGSITINGKKILQEWKSSNTYFGKYYATAYLKYCWCELETKSLIETIGRLFEGTNDEFKKAEQQIFYSSSLISKLKDFISNRYNWNEKGICEDKIFMPDEDNVYLVVENDGELYTNYPDFKASKYQFQCAFGKSLGTKYFEEFCELKEFTRDYLMNLVEILSDLQEQNQIVWQKNRNKNKFILSKLKNCLEAIQNGDVIKIRFLPSRTNILQIASKNNNTIEDIDVEDEYYLYDLFSKNELYCLGADCKITSKTELAKLIYYFNVVEKRNSNIEIELKRFYDSISENDKIEVVIEGSF